MRAVEAGRGMLLALVAALVVALGHPGAATAVEPDEILSDPQLEARARQISAGLRCVVCQNQSIDDSNAPLARDLRLIVRERLKAGDSDAKVVDYVVERYGKFVLLRPPVGPDTLLLWLAPLVLLAGGVALFRRHMAADAAATGAQPEPLTAAEQRRLSELTGADDAGGAAKHGQG